LSYSPRCSPSLKSNTYILIVTCHHVTVRHLIADTVSWLIRVICPVRILCIWISISIRAHSWVRGLLLWRGRWSNWRGQCSYGCGNSSNSGGS
jgi:hypothetical protein